MADLPIAEGVRFALIAGFDGYAVGDNGTVWSKYTRNGIFAEGWRPVSSYRRPYGSKYHVVSLREDNGRGKVICRYIHRLVLEAFIGPAPKGVQALHGDGDTDNNRLANLRWGTPKENAQDKVRHGTMRRKVSELAEREICELAANKIKYRVIAERFGIHVATVSKVVCRNRKSLAQWVRARLI